MSSSSIEQTNPNTVNALLAASSGNFARLFDIFVGDVLQTSECRAAFRQDQGRSARTYLSQSPLFLTKTCSGRTIQFNAEKL